MTSSEVALIFGVVTPETAEKMEWKHKTSRVWYRRVESMPYTLCNVFRHNDKVRLCSATDNSLVDILHIENFATYTVPAPQMHEIAKYLPNEILVDAKYDNETDILFLLNVCKKSIYYETNDNIKYGCSKAKGFEEKSYVAIENHHYAQACAELYIELLDAGLLKTDKLNA
jgi:hypothetical protein